MSRLWLTYAWIDNEDQDVEYVAQELEKIGVKVGYDKIQLLAGRSVWEQIDDAIRDPETTGFAMFVTENSLKSRPCREELQYAIRRVMQAKEVDFPVIGLFPQPVDNTIVPAAIDQRLYVNLTSPSWAQSVKDAFLGQNTYSRGQISGYGHKDHTEGPEPIYEVWPRVGRWYPFQVLVPKGQRDKIQLVTYGPRGVLPMGEMIAQRDIWTDDGLMEGREIFHAIDAQQSAFIYLNSKPTTLVFGDRTTWFKCRP